ncbi:aminoimidazole riboside kinase [Desertibacillus haloalkaliphilus]|uniref:aminoimidazole riboside kinase n=1 Tax=Desertibacillus haloalkaliphilus TaxID=1328930 RepID=UPI001C27696E|nr:aminoimidazole riboside kinase [Desertibacillus haloalkaliphilus]MBU8905306.1 aminoimidazole riboside kinase [Desertibacillus haloalkaliphilus]
MKHGVISLGEALIDFIPLDKENLSFQKSPGGAPANVAVGLARLGAKSTFLGKVGDDVLGRFLKETLERYNVGTDHMHLTTDTRTGVVFVTLDQHGERSFDFYIDPSADRMLTTDEVDPSLFTDHNILHFGSISLISEPAKTATKTAVQLAKEQGLFISYDPNLRLSLWPDETTARETIVSMLSEADLVKISEEELEFITGFKEIEAGVQALKDYNIPALLITLGAGGSYLYYQDSLTHVPAMTVETVDTTGAGDAFVSGILYQLDQYEGSFSEMTVQQLKEMMEFASVSGGLAAATKGAMTALPTLEQVKDVLQSRS